MRLGPLVCGLLIGSLYTSPGCLSTWVSTPQVVVFFGVHEPGLTKIFANPGQQFSTRAGSGNIPSL